MYFLHVIPLTRLKKKMLTDIWNRTPEYLAFQASLQASMPFRIK